MSNIVIQGITIFAIFAFAVLGLNFYEPNDDWNLKIFKEPKTYKTLGIIFGVLAILCFAYFVCDNFIFHRVSWFWAIVKLIVVIIGILAFIFIEDNYFDTVIPFIGTLMVYLVLITVASLIFAFGEGLTIEFRQEEEYESKIIAVEEPKVSTKSFNLISINDITDIETSYDVTLSNDATFYIITETKQEDSKDGPKNYEAYSVYYSSKDKPNKVEPLTINKDKADLYFIEEGENPHITIITSTYYSLDTNVEPNKECNHKKELSYELHVPKSSILNAEKKESKQNN